MIIRLKLWNPYYNQAMDSYMDLKAIVIPN